MTLRTDNRRLSQTLHPRHQAQQSAELTDRREDGVSRHPVEDVHHKDCGGGLLFRSFCVVWFDLFSLRDSSQSHPATFLEPLNSSIDAQIFDLSFLAAEPIARYHLDGFEMRLQLEDKIDSPIISGHVHVRASLLFDEIACLTYRVIVSPDEIGCSATRSLTTDQMILLAGVPVGVEHWHTQGAPGTDPLAKLDLEIVDAEIWDLPVAQSGRPQSPGAYLRGSGSVLHAVFERYRCMLVGEKRARSIHHRSHYSLVDVWEDVQHEKGGRTFDDMEAGEIIEHIETLHRAELMGLLTLYPYEWKYRDHRYFPRVCGQNIAIDVDDLVLVSDTVGVIFGTYGLRGREAPTNWKEVLESGRRTEHVCWPEYLHILEMSLARLHAVGEALSGLHHLRITGSGALNHRKALRTNALAALQLNQRVIAMDAVRFSRYAAHKRMFEATEEQLGVEKEFMILSSAMRQLDESIKTIDTLDQMDRSRLFKVLLSFITIASVFQVIFEDVDVPLMRHLMGAAESNRLGVFLISIVALGLILTAVVILGSAVSRAVRFISSRIRRQL